NEASVACQVSRLFCLGTSSALRQRVTGHGARGLPAQIFDDVAATVIRCCEGWQRSLRSTRWLRMRDVRIAVRGKRVPNDKIGVPMTEHSWAKSASKMLKPLSAKVHRGTRHVSEFSRIDFMRP